MSKSRPLSGKSAGFAVVASLPRSASGAGVASSLAGALSTLVFLWRLDWFVKVRPRSKQLESGF